MTIYIASDHAGYKLKDFLLGQLSAAGYTVTDCGAFTFAEGDDYPVYIDKAAKHVSEAYQDPLVAASSDVRGIVIGGSGQGEAIAANRFPRVRAALYYGGNTDIVKLSREHNNANILSLGARFLSEQEALDAVDLWLQTPFSTEPKHARRVAEIDNLPASLL